MTVCKPVEGRPLHFWHVAGDVVMKPAFGRPIPLDPAHFQHLRGLFRAHARAARKAGDKDARRLWTEKWVDLGNAMDALALWPATPIKDSEGLMSALRASVDLITNKETNHGV